MASSTKNYNPDVLSSSINFSSSISDDLLRTSTSEDEPEIPVSPTKRYPQSIIAHSIDQSGKIKYLVKYRNRSYYELEWLESNELMNLLSNMSMIRNYQKNQDIHISTKPPYFNNDYLIPEKIITEQVCEGQIKYLIKWFDLDYVDATWESIDFIKQHHFNVSYNPNYHDSENNVNLDQAFENALKQYRKLSIRPSDKELKIPHHPNPNSFSPIKQNNFPKSKNGFEVRSYQVEGVNFLIKLWYLQKNAILADEMGLGKTLQSLMFLNMLVARQKIWGPFLIIAPLSTIPNWEREANEWTELRYLSFYGSKTRRSLMLQNELFYIDSKIPKFQILFTTYEYAVKMIDVFNKIEWQVIILDEAHRIKNNKSKLFSSLMKLQTKFKLLITGTPLQNNTNELWTLLHYLNDEKFNDSKEFNEKFGNLSEAEQIEDLQQILRPLMLRRLKGDVEKSITPFEEIIIECPMSQHQKAYYTSIYQQNMQYLTRGQHTVNQISLRNICMELRKCCNHPYLINGAEKQIMVERREAQKLKEMGNSYSQGQNGQNSSGLIVDGEKFECECLIRSSGKMILLDKLLAKMKKDGHRVLIFSQMVRMLDIIQDYLNFKEYKFQRIDGGIKGELRQRAIDSFNSPESNDFVFLLGTKAGGVGINLTSADTVIIYDSDWNPQNDIQATARCHRIGQTKDVKVYRFLTANSYERTLFDSASHKLGLDAAVLGGSCGLSPKKQTEQIEKMLKLGAYYAFSEDNTNNDEEQKINEEDIDSILKRSQIIKHDHIASGVEGSTFSKLQFEIEPDSNLDLSAPNFWQKYIPKEAEKSKNAKRRSQNKTKKIESKSSTASYSSESNSSSENNISSESDNDSYSETSANLSLLKPNSDDEFLQSKKKRKNKKSKKSKTDYSFSSSDNEMADWSEGELASLLKLLIQFGLGRWDVLYDHSKDIKNKHSISDIRNASISILQYLISYSSNSSSFSIKEKSILEDAFLKGLRKSHRDSIDQFIKDHMNSLESITKVDKSFPLSKLLYLFFLNATISSCKDPPNDIPIPNNIQGTKPTSWWSEKDDQLLLFHAWKKGLGDFRSIRLTHNIIEKVSTSKNKKKNKKTDQSSNDENDDEEIPESIKYVLTKRMMSVLLEVKLLFSLYHDRVAYDKDIVYNSKTLKKAINLWTIKEQRRIISTICNIGTNNLSKCYTASAIPNKPFKKFKKFVNKIVNECSRVFGKEVKDDHEDDEKLPEGITKSLAEKVLTRIQMIDKLSKMDDLSQYSKIDQGIIMYLKENGFVDLNKCPEIVEKFSNDKVGQKVNNFVQELLGFGPLESDKQLIYYNRTNNDNESMSSYQKRKRSKKDEQNEETEINQKNVYRKNKIKIDNFNDDDDVVEYKNANLNTTKNKTKSVKKSSVIKSDDEEDSDVQVTGYHKSDNNNNDNALLPLTIQSNLIIISLGTVVKDRPGFHNDKYIYPAGYISEHLFTSIKNPIEKAWYRSLIIDDGSQSPVFRVEMKDDPTIFFEGKNPTNPWTQLVRAVDKVKQDLNIGSHSTTSISGPVYFGFATPEVRKMIKSLPGASQDKTSSFSPVKTESKIKTRSYDLPKKTSLPATRNTRKRNTKPIHDDYDYEIDDYSESSSYSNSSENEDEDDSDNDNDNKSKDRNNSSSQPYSSPLANESDDDSFLSIKNKGKNKHKKNKELELPESVHFHFDQIDFDFQPKEEIPPFSLSRKAVEKLLRQKYDIPPNEDPITYVNKQGWIF